MNWIDKIIKWQYNKMETIFKQTIKSGNASAVVLPKTWLNKKVKIELIDKTPEIILYDVLEIVKSKIDLSEIIGVYLVGSHARGDKEDLSDVDILVISEKTSKEVIKKGDYEILIVSLDLLDYKLKENLLPVGTMLKESKPLLNNKFLREIKMKIKATKKNVKWFLETTNDRLRTIKGSIDRIEKSKPDGKLSDVIAYSLILRLRTLYMIDCLRKNKDYNKDEFIKLVKQISGSLTAYERYVYLKNNFKDKRLLLVSEGRKLYEYVNDYLKKIKDSIK